MKHSADVNRNDRARDGGVGSRAGSKSVAGLRDVCECDCGR